MAEQTWYFIKRSSPASQEYAVMLPVAGLLMVEKETQPVLKVNEVDAGGLIGFGGWQPATEDEYNQYVSTIPDGAA